MKTWLRPYICTDGPLSAGDSSALLSSQTSCASVLTRSFFLPDDDPWFKWLLWNVHSPPDNLSEWEAAPPGLASAYIDQRKRFACLLKFVSFTSRGRKTPRNGKVWLGLYLRSILMRLGVFYSHHTLGEVINGSVKVLTLPAGRCLAPYLTSIIYYIRWLICIHTIQIWKK